MLQSNNNNKTYFAEVLAQIAEKKDDDTIYYIYKSHNKDNVYYSTDKELSFEDVYCPECEDADELIVQGTRFELLIECALDYNLFNKIAREEEMLDIG